MVKIKSIFFFNKIVVHDACDDMIAVPLLRGEPRSTYEIVLGERGVVIKLHFGQCWASNERLVHTCIAWMEGCGL